MKVGWEKFRERLDNNVIEEEQLANYFNVGSMELDIDLMDNADDFAIVMETLNNNLETIGEVLVDLRVWSSLKN